MSDTVDIVNRFVKVWNEPDLATRRAQVEALWSPSGVHYVNITEARGHDALVMRVTSAYENVKQNGNRFILGDTPVRLRDAVKFHWHMVPKGGDKVLAVGLEFLIIAPDGRIERDYQYIV
jgi:hypothetical protein